VEAFEAANLPLLFDEVDKRIIWPGSSEYDEWAATSPQEAAEDEEVSGANSTLCCCMPCATHDAQHAVQYSLRFWCPQGGRQ
jgi:hypothetical protein